MRRSATAPWRSRTRARRVALALLAVAALAGCGGGNGDAEISAEDFRELVLQPADLPPVFTRFDVGPIGFADLPVGPRAGERRFGRRGGWKARYRRSGSVRTRGPLIVVSMVDVFAEDRGAERELEAHSAEFEARVRRSSGTARRLSSPRIGDGAHAMTVRQPAFASPVRYFFLVWRQGNVAASVSVSGFAGRIAFGDALQLARKQERRIVERLTG